MNWIATWTGAAIIGAVMLAMGRNLPRNDKGEAHATVQFAHMALIIGVFGLIAVYTTLSLAMLLFVLVSGVVWAVDKWYLARRRKQGERQSDEVELFAGLFPVIAVVFLVRSFLFEPFTIPSSSMRPGLEPGDFILVNRFSYGIRVPVLNTVLIETGKPQRGDVMVFRYPVDPKTDFIKRVVGLPGDTVTYRNKQLTVNGKPVTQVALAEGSYVRDNSANLIPVQRFKETTATRSYVVQTVEQAPPVNQDQVLNFPFRDNCQYDDSGFTCKVPVGHYFMMGDNRDDSSDGRYWGFVPDENIVGKATLIWMNIGAFSRIGTSIQ